MNEIVGANGKTLTKKLTHYQHARRVDWVERKLRRGRWLAGDLVKEIRSRYDDMGLNKSYELIREARDKLVLNLNRKRGMHRAQSLAFYEGIIDKWDATVAEKLSAQMRIDKLLGLEQPSLQRVQVEHTGAVKHEVSVDQLNLPIAVRRELLEALRAHKQLTNGDADSDATDVEEVEAN